MGALSFLNQGTPPSASSNYSQSSTQLPSWYTDYTQQILNTAAQFAAQPYQAYQGPRIASQDPNSVAAEGQTSGLPASASSTTQAAQNLVQQGESQNNPLAAAQGYLNAGTDPTYNTTQQYMNPYMNTVLGGIANAANTNFNNYTMPSLQSSIIGAGNITGSSTEGTNLMENAEQQNEQNITNAQAGALGTGYSSALQAAQAGNANALTAAQQAASAQESQANTSLNAGADTASIGSQGTQNQINSINAENQMGQQQQGYNQSNLNLAYQDFLQQQQYPMTMAADMQGALSGIQVPTAQVNYNYGTGVNGGNGSAQGSATSPLATLFGSGANLAGTLSGQQQQPVTLT
jgi:hypothetical protein